FEGLFENLRFQRLLAQEPMKFANLVLQSPILRSRHDLFPAAGRSQTALRHQPTPGEQLVWGNAMPTSHQAYRHTRLEGLFDHANLLRGRPAPTTLNRRDDLNAIGQIGHRHGCMPHTCQVGDRVRSVRGLSQVLSPPFSPILLFFPLYGRCIQVLHFEPIERAAGASVTSAIFSSARKSERNQLPVDSRRSQYSACEGPKWKED